jgi:hypothetical protein
MNQDDFLKTESRYDTQKQLLVITVTAKILIGELQGDVDTFITPYQATIPKHFQKILFGQGVNIPEEMLDVVSL